MVLWQRLGRTPQIFAFASCFLLLLVQCSRHDVITIERMHGEHCGASFLLLNRLERGGALAWRGRYARSEVRVFHPKGEERREEKTRALRRQSSTTYGDRVQPV